MDNKTINWIIAAIIALFFGTTFISQNSIFDRDNRVEDTMIQIRKAIKEEDWDIARMLFYDFNDDWGMWKYLVAINNAEQEYRDFNNNLKVLKGSIDMKDGSQGVKATLLLESDWINFKKLVPEP